MPNYICLTCGVQFAETDQPPAECPICNDERQYVKASGQQWTTLEDMHAGHYKTRFEVQEPNLITLVTEPSFAIGQRPLMVQTPEGNYLWDCNSYIDDDTIVEVQQHGGLAGIAISHPHFYDSMVEWSRAFGNIPIYLHASNRQYVMRPDDSIVFWEDETYTLSPSLTLIRCGGHFEGSTVLHWKDGAEGKGVLMTGDTIMVVADTNRVSFMYSYPNLIPMGPKALNHILRALQPYQFDRLYAGWFDKVVQSNAKQVVEDSADLYLRMISEG